MRWPGASATPAAATVITTVTRTTDPPSSPLCLTDLLYLWFYQPEVFFQGIGGGPA